MRYRPGDRGVGSSSFFVGLPVVSLGYTPGNRRHDIGSLVVAFVTPEALVVGRRGLHRPIVTRVGTITSRPTSTSGVRCLHMCTTILVT